MGSQELGARANGPKGYAVFFMTIYPKWSAQHNMVWATTMGWGSDLSSQTACGPGPCWLDKLAPRGEQLVSISLFLTTLGSSQERSSTQPSR